MKRDLTYLGIIFAGGVIATVAARILNDGATVEHWVVTAPYVVGVLIGALIQALKGGDA